MSIAVVVPLALVGAALTVREPSRPRDAVPAGGGPRWTRIATDTVRERLHHTAVWAGDRMIVWGGIDFVDHSGVRLADGAGYDPAADTWTPIAASPLAARAHHAAVWTGREMIVWGGGTSDEQFTDGAAYDPSTDTWRMLPPSPLRGFDYVDAVWTGSEMVVLGFHDFQELEAAVYDPAADRWRAVATPDAGGQATAAVWTGEEVLVWLDGEDGTTDRPNLQRPLAYDPEGDSWRELAAPPIGQRSHGTVVWTGEEAIVWGGATGHWAEPGADGPDATAAYTPVDDSWRMLPPAPIPGRSWHTAVWTGEEMVVCGGGPYGGPLPDMDCAAFRPESDTWRALPSAGLTRRAGHTAVWADDRMILWGGHDYDHEGEGDGGPFTDGGVWRP